MNVDDDENDDGEDKDYICSVLYTYFVSMCAYSATALRPCRNGNGKPLSLETLRPRNMSDNSWAQTIFADQETVAQLICLKQ